MANPVVLFYLGAAKLAKKLRNLFHLVFLSEHPAQLHEDFPASFT